MGTHDVVVGWGGSPTKGLVSFPSLDHQVPMEGPVPL